MKVEKMVLVAHSDSSQVWMTKFISFDVLPASIYYKKLYEKRSKINKLVMNCWTHVALVPGVLIKETSNKIS